MARYRQFFESLVKTYPKSVYLLVWLVGLEWLWIHQFQNNRDLATIYIHKIFRPTGNFLRQIFNYSSLHFGLIISFFVILLILIYLIKKTLNKQFKLLIISMLMFWVIGYPIYMFLWGFTYGLGYKNNTITSLAKKNTTFNEVVALTQDFIYLSKNYENYGDKNMHFDTIANKASFYNDIADFSTSDTLKVKTGIFSKLLAKMGTGGFYSFWTGEIFVSNIHKTSALPFVISHEMAHATGYAAEDESNYFAFKNCINAPDSLFQYSAIREVIQIGLHTVYEQDSIKFIQLKSSLPKFVQKDFEKENSRWKPYRNSILREISSTFYNNFLLFNGQNQGNKSYHILIYNLIDLKKKTGHYY